MKKTLHSYQAALVWGAGLATLIFLLPRFLNLGAGAHYASLSLQIVLGSFLSLVLAAYSVGVAYQFRTSKWVKRVFLGCMLQLCPAMLYLLASSPLGPHLNLINVFHQYVWAGPVFQLGTFATWTAIQGLAKNARKTDLADGLGIASWLLLLVQIGGAWAIFRRGSYDILMLLIQALLYVYAAHRIRTLVNQT